VTCVLSSKTKTKSYFFNSSNHYDEPEVEVLYFLLL